MEITWIAVLVAGALSFLSPCVLPLVPPYLCYMAGVSVEELRGDGARRRPCGKILGVAAAFIVGFALVFVALGASASVLGAFLLRWQNELGLVAGLLIIMMGCHFLGLFRLPFLLREFRFQARDVSSGPVGAFVMGLAFAFGWTPCIGPILAPILTLAAGQETVLAGAGLLALYALGLAVPFTLAAVFSDFFMRWLTHFRLHLGKIEKLVGVLLIVTGIAFISGQMQFFSFWLLETFPALQQLG